ncbi:MAG: ArnT family glycosyltransferase, partial [Planctomycetota bacterium]
RPDGTVAYSVTAVRCLQSVFGALSCWLLYWVGCLTFGRGVGILCGLTAACYGLFVYYDGLLMPTSQILFVHLLAMALFLIALRRGALGWWLSAGIVLGLCAVAHGTAVLIFPGVLIWAWVGSPGTDRRTRALRMLTVALGFTPIVGAVTLRNYVVGNDFVLLTSNAGKNFYIGNNPTADGSYRLYRSNMWGSELGHYLGSVKRTPDDLPPSQVSRHFSRMARQFMLENPGTALALLGRKLRLCFHAVETGINDQFYFAKRFSGVLRAPLLTFGIVV